MAIEQGPPSLMQKAQHAVHEAKLVEQLKELGEVRVNLTQEQEQARNLRKQLQEQADAAKAQEGALEKQVLDLKIWIR